MNNLISFRLIFVFVFFFSSLNSYAQNADKKSLLKSSSFSAFKFRNNGTAFASGLISDFAVNPHNTLQYYVAVAAGHVWKTENIGITFILIFDDYGSYSIADVEIYTIFY